MAKLQCGSFAALCGVIEVRCLVQDLYEEQ